MMPTQNALLTSDSSKGRRYVEICRAQYDKAELQEEEAQVLNEHPGFAAYLAAGIRRFSQKGPVFPVWLEIEVGGKSKDELTTLNKGAERETSNYAADIMGKDAWKPGQVEVVKFARVKVRELGFTKNPTTREIWARIEELGHSLCEPADGPALGAAFMDQPKGDICWTAMKQITASGGSPSVFVLERDDFGDRWLYADWAGPGDEWDLVDGVVFRLRK